jgi:diadenosine tetraphosphatase ApaH/serine/threonine PP2A family protein phosphatase
LDEYVFPEDVHNRHKLDKIFAQIQRHSFVGHTHIPGIFTAGGQFIGAHEVSDGYRLGEEKTIVNVGSVGQPRDGDPRACFAVLDGETVSFFRVAYPVARTVEKIHAIAQLDGFLGDRLFEGR